MRRIWFWLVGFGIAAGAAGFFIWKPAGGSAADAAYRLAAVERGPVTASVRATGTLNPVTTVLVGSQLSGQVVEVLADYNTPVKEGQVVARLYSEQIRSRRDAAMADLAQGQADRETKRAQIDKARSQLQKAEAVADDLAAQRDRATAQLAEAQRNFERQTELTARAVGTQNALDQAKTQLDVQRATIASAVAQIASNRAEQTGLKADISLAEAALKSADALILQREAKLKDIEIDLARTDIRSPVEGVVVKRDIELGQTVAASLSAPTLFTIAQDLREIDIYANIDEADVGRLRPDQKVTFTVNAYPNRTFGGTVRLVRLGAQTVQNVVTYTAVISVKNGDQALLPGMTANLQIVTDERDNALRIPNAALRFRPAGAPAVAATKAPDSEGQGGKRQARNKEARADSENWTAGRVYQLDSDGNPQAVVLRLGVTDGNYTEVIRGDLKEGAPIVVGIGSRNGGDAAGAPVPRQRAPRLF
ncbi:efflux RND transporter periplasmic adaptor subunit [Microvirga alba]|uniref:Efflux RND transporter periplasmic adaptor subunit n=1 Tax=Microvirga alba TaxID=2791025 RepID=A0A931BTN5_9HYPH|nr:efflux RND transporter periplasmic adaptor subunit [Microvirga alba]MBF9233605.1 efflux RND transporter periplasmic adaptor subunit [Microvirga alba]